MKTYYTLYNYYPSLFYLKDSNNLRGAFALSAIQAIKTYTRNKARNALKVHTKDGSFVVTRIFDSFPDRENYPELYI